MPAIYDTIGVGYATCRQADPRIAAAIHAELGRARSVLNVGAGTGSYEPDWLEVTAVEPSAEMIRQRPHGSAPVVRATAEDLPFADRSFDAAMAILTVHHWSDVTRGLDELRRVTRGPIVLLSFDPSAAHFWLSDYLPALAELDLREMPRPADIEAVLGPVRRIPVPIPHDCRDGFLCAYWRRPAAYLDPMVRRSISSFSKIGDPTEGLARLRSDLESGAWEKRYRDLLAEDARDFGYVLLVAG